MSKKDKKNYNFKEFLHTELQQSQESQQNQENKKNDKSLVKNKIFEQKSGNLTKYEKLSDLFSLN